MINKLINQEITNEIELDLLNPNSLMFSKLKNWIINSEYSSFAQLYGGKNSLMYEEIEEGKRFLGKLDKKEKFVLDIDVKLKTIYNDTKENIINVKNENINNIFDIKKLYNHYPQLKNINIDMIITNTTHNIGNSDFNYKNQNIRIYASSPKKAISLLLHEFQHMIQVIEDFQIGNSIDLNNTKDFLSILSSEKRKESLKEWIKDSKIKDEKNEPIILYHGTTNNIEIFDKEKTILGTHHGKSFYFSDNIVDINKNYANKSGPDLLNKKNQIIDEIKYVEEEIEYVKEKISDHNLLKKDEDYIEYKLKKKKLQKELKDLSNSGENIIPVYLKMKNPLILDKKSSDIFEIIYEEKIIYLENGDEYYQRGEDLFNDKNEKIDYLIDYDSEINKDILIIDNKKYEIENEDYNELINPIGLGYEIIKNLEDIISKYEYNNLTEIIEKLSNYIFEYQPNAFKIEEFLRNYYSFIYLEDDEEEMISNEVIKEMWKKMGYDGIIMKNAENIFPNMGMEEETTHYMVFEENQIKSIFSNYYTDDRYIMESEKSNLSNILSILPDEMLRKDFLKLIDNLQENDKKMIMKKIKGMKKINKKYLLNEFNLNINEFSNKKESLNMIELEIIEELYKKECSKLEKNNKKREKTIKHNR